MSNAVRKISQRRASLLLAKDNKDLIYTVMAMNRQLGAIMYILNLLVKSSISELTDEERVALAAFLESAEVAEPVESPPAPEGTAGV